MTISEFDNYQLHAARTLAADMPLNESLSMAALGLAGEAGEVVELIKKHLHHGHELDREKLTKELGDVLWYVAALATVNGIRFDDVASANIAKLRQRYPEGFSHAASVGRTDEVKP